MTAKLPLVFAVHATSRGFGYVAFEGPFTPYDWGTVATRGDKNASALRKLEKLLGKLEPETLLLEEPSSVAHRSKRITRLYRAVIAMCEARNIEVAVYRLQDIKACFAGVGAKTRQEIAEAIGRQIPALDYTLPNPRKPWDSDSRRMAPFCATALVLTHYQLGVKRLFDDLA